MFRLSSVHYIVRLRRDLEEVSLLSRLTSCLAKQASRSTPDVYSLEGRTCKTPVYFAWYSSGYSRHPHAASLGVVVSQHVFIQANCRSNSIPLPP